MRRLFKPVPGAGVRAGLVAAVTCALAVSLVGGPAEALAPGGAVASRTTAAPVTSSSTGSAEGSAEGSAPTAADLAAQQQELARLEAAALAQTDQLQRARAALTAAAAQAGAALQAYSTAVRAMQEAQIDEDRQRSRLLKAQLDLAAAQQFLGRWAREAYTTGTLSDHPAVVTFLESTSTDDLGTAMTWLRRVGRSKSRSVEAFQQAEAAQTSAALAAAQASAAASTAAAAAATAKQQRDDAVARQRATVGQLQASLAATQNAAVEARTRTVMLARALVIAQQRERAALGRGGNAVTGPVGSCRGGPVELYANGEIPPSALCGIWGAPGQLLRADAAAAFNRMSRAYAGHFGAPICVTDSYRTYAQQVDLYARKPDLAAIPGTSNHGWGIATDLCGGVESFGTATHTWLALNAPLYGWFHPAWAEQNGSRPEPWHFEFAG